MQKIDLDYQNIRKNNKCLSIKEKEKFEQLHHLLNAKIQENRLIVTYRGEKKERLEKKLGEKYNTKKFFNRLFYFGEKAKIYYKQSKESLENKDYLKSITDISDDTFQFIFQEINKIITSKNIHSQKYNRVQDFIENEQSFTAFFRDNSNLPNFCSNLKKINEKDKFRIRNYYLYFIHTHGLGNNSLFVSTSLEKSIAQSFAIDGDRQKTQGIIIYNFIPNSLIEYYCISHSNNWKLINIKYQNLELPTYTHDLYPEQKEVAIIGALFPHFIFGIHNIKNELFQVNPHIFTRENFDIYKILEDGFDIDQENFHQEVIKTGYTGYITRKKRIDSYLDKFYR